MSAWNDFVKKIYWENKKKNKNFQFKDALREASRRKGEMGSSSKSKSMKSMKMDKSMNMKSKKCCPCPKKRKTRKSGRKGMFF
jgi:ribosomal protein L44E